MENDPSGFWAGVTRIWPALEKPLSWVLGAGLLIFEAVTHGTFHPELIFVGAGLVGYPLLRPGGKS